MAVGKKGEKSEVALTFRLGDCCWRGLQEFVQAVITLVNLFEVCTVGIGQKCVGDLQYGIFLVL